MAKAAHKAPSVARDMQRDMGAAAALKEQLAGILGDDLDAMTLRDMLQGETGLFETIDAVLAQIGDDAARVAGIERFSETLAARKQRLEARGETLRAMLTNTLDMIGDKRLERPLATVTLKATAPKLTIVEEGRVPSRFWMRPEPVLARRELGDALKARAGALAEIDEALRTGACDAATAAARRQAALAEHPEIPGAALDNGGVTVQIRFG